MKARDCSGPRLEAAPVTIYECKILRLTLLAPDNQRDIIVGRQPRGFKLEAFVQGDVPLGWVEQCQVLGWRCSCARAELLHPSYDGISGLFASIKCPDMAKIREA